jgi:N-acetyl-anhydromuramyl-L-alanine amidase AmpD
MRPFPLLLLLPLLLPLAGCDPRRAEKVPQLEESDLPRLGDEELERCVARLGLAPEVARPADATNFGERQRRDEAGRTVPHEPQLIVLHETVIPADATVRLFQTPHPDDADQASYHLLVDAAGRRLRFVPDGERAFGAGLSAWGDFTVRIRPASLGSINNVALHLAFETPPDGRGDAPAHAGYSESQYDSAAAQVLLWQARFGIPMRRLTTHAAVDRSHSRYDPRSFRWDRFDRAHQRAAERCGLDGYGTLAPAA